MVEPPSKFCTIGPELICLCSPRQRTNVSVHREQVLVVMCALGFSFMVRQFPNRIRNLNAFIEFSVRIVGIPLSSGGSFELDLVLPL